MSSWRFKNVQRARNVIIVLFNNASQSEWGDIMSVTIPADDAKRLLVQLQAALHPRGSHRS